MHEPFIISDRHFYEETVFGLNVIPKNMFHTVPDSVPTFHQKKFYTEEKPVEHLRKAVMEIKQTDKYYHTLECGHVIAKKYRSYSKTMICKICKAEGEMKK